VIKPTGAPEPNFITYGAVLGCHDGDTIEVLRDLGHDVYYKTSFRLLGIDTPEVNRRAEKQYGLLARQHLIDLISQTTQWWEEETPWGKIRQPILVMKSVEADKFGGRWLGEIWLPKGKGQLQLQMIEDKYGRTYDGDAKKIWDFKGYPER